MKMLERSGVENYCQGLSVFGIDTSSPTVWEDRARLLEQELNELEALAAEIMK